ncbi:Asp23/Gls24 family envelope stress response protein [Streptomyces sp. NPDC059883]|uniref:Asp23/Gls24 family envelope stress response protein n=1 Tax=unclassified Streptomyces TaxID=2593676 RepID=UPI0036575989
METSATAASGAHTGRNGVVKGKTDIADAVVSAIAGIAARETPGVYAMGGGVSRTLGAMRDKVGRSDDPARGVKVEVGEKQAAIDLDIVVEYGTPIEEAADNIRSNVTDAVERMTGREVVEANVSVLDVHVPGMDDEDDRSREPTRAR